MTALPAPIIGPDQTVSPEWTDYNGHLNMAYYHVLFDEALETALRLIGLGADRARDEGSSVFTVQAQIHYLRELNAGDVVRVETRHLAHDAKRLHYVQTMRHARDGWAAAVTENLILHVDLTTRRVARFPADVSARLDMLATAHADLPVASQVGRIVGLHRPRDHGA